MHSTNSITFNKPHFISLSKDISINDLDSWFQRGAYPTQFYTWVLEKRHYDQINEVSSYFDTTKGGLWIIGQQDPYKRNGNNAPPNRYGFIQIIPEEGLRVVFSQEKLNRTNELLRRAGIQEDLEDRILSDIEKKLHTKGVCPKISSIDVQSQSGQLPLPGF